MELVSRIGWALVVAAGLLLGSGAAEAHPGHGGEELPLAPMPLRGWRIAGEAKELSGSFMRERDGRVLLQTRDGQVEVAFARLSDRDRSWVRSRMETIARLNQAPSQVLRVATPVGEGSSGEDAPPAAAAFAPFRKKVKVRWDERTLYVESDGLPEHGMMKGIRSWQQQVPLPQNYTGSNAWRIPLKPVLAERPISARTALFRGAIALAVNGVPIFNALNNRGEDAFLAGELDEWGGHCGRADDYHYHAAPLHLEETVGKGKPIAYALDGFPLYGLTNPDGSPVGRLDEFNGKFDAAGNYRYHATKTYPYVNGGLRGVVEVRGGQVEPQPRANPVRPAMPPLRGARITDFQSTGPGAHRLVFTFQEQKFIIDYSRNADGAYRFRYTSPDGRSAEQTYRSR